MTSWMHLFVDDESQPVTWDPANKGANVALSNGNLTAEASGGVPASVRSTTGKTTGKWYFEVNMDTLYYAQNAPQVGTANESLVITSNDALEYANSWSVRTFEFGTGWTNGDGSNKDSGLTINGVIMVAVDIAAGKIWFGRNGAWSGNPAAGTGEMWANLHGTTIYAASYVPHSKVTARFKVADQSYSVPSGFSAWDS